MIIILSLSVNLENTKSLKFVFKSIFDELASKNIAIFLPLASGNIHLVSEWHHYGTSTYIVHKVDAKYLKKWRFLKISGTFMFGALL